MASSTAVMYPIVSALVKAEEMDGMGPDRIWYPVPGRDERAVMQKEFLGQDFEPCHEEVGSIPEIESVASWSVADVNAFLKSRGFDIALQPMGSDSFAVGSVLGLLVEWLGGGTVTEVLAKNRRSYPGVDIKKGVTIVTSASHDHPIVTLQTKSGDMVSMTPIDEQLEGFALVDKALEISGGWDNLDEEHEGVIFPMVDYNEQVDIGWLTGLRTVGNDGSLAIVAQALQQTKFRMNEVGARAQSAVAIGVLRGGPMVKKTPFIIDQPFLLWIERSGLSRPLFVGSFDYEHWKRPASL